MAGERPVEALEGKEGVAQLLDALQQMPQLRSLVGGAYDGTGAPTATVLLALRARSTSLPRSPPLSSILQACGITLDEAVRELPAAAAALDAPLAEALGAGPPAALRAQLRELQQAYVLHTLLAKKARDLFAEYFSLPADAQPASPLGFLWLLFCSARASLAPQADLVTSFSLLLACVHLMLLHAPPQHVRGGAAAGAAGGGQQPAGRPADQQEDGAAGGDLLLQVAASHSAADHIGTIRQLSSLLRTLAWQVLLPALPAGSQLANGGSSDAAAATAAPWPIPGLLDAEGQPAAAAVEALQQHQRQAASGADIDALAFLGAAPPPTPRPAAVAVQPALPAGGAPAAAPPGRVAAAAAAAAEVAEGRRGAAAAPLGGDGGAEQRAASPMAVDEPAPAVPEPAGPAAAPGAQQQQQQAVKAEEQQPQPPQQPPQEQPRQEQRQEEGEQEELACTPRAAQQAAAGVGSAGGAAAAAAAAAAAELDASYHTPSPAKRARVAHPARPPPATPITSALSAAAWLRGVVAGQPEGPSPALQAAMRAAGLGEAGEARLAAAAQAMAAAVFPDPAGQPDGPLLALEQSTAAARRSEALRLYWRSLEALLGAEAARPGAAPAGAAAALLAAPLFHRCVAACAFESVAAAYRMGGLAFPAILERLHLPAFDLVKAIDPFVQHLPAPPRDLKRHMLSVEERCLESLAWQPGSSLYASLAAAVGPCGGGGGGDGAAAAPAAAAPDAQASQQQQQQQQQQQGEQEREQPASSQGDAGSNEQQAEGQEGEEQGEQGAGPGGDADMAEASGTEAEQPQQREEQQEQQEQQGQQQQGQQQQPQQQQQQPPGAGYLPLCLGAEPGAGGGQGRPGSPRAEPAGNRSARVAADDFLRRALKLAAIRLADLLSRLDLQPADPHLLLAEAYTLARHVAYDQTWLLYGRHLDQAMLCCAYAVCKVRQLGGASFKAIIAAYKRQPQARGDVFKTVNMTPREETRLPLQPTGTADVIAFYNRVFIPAVKPFLMQLAQDRGLLVQPPATALPAALHTPPRAVRQLLPPGGASPPALPSAALRGGRPASLQTPCPPLLPDGGWPSPTPPPRGLAATPSRGAQLLSPGAWRLSRGHTTPLASPRAERGLLANGSPSPGAARLRAVPPLSVPALHRLFGAGPPGAAQIGMPLAIPVLLPAAPAQPAQPPSSLPAAVPDASFAAVQAMFAGAEAAAAAAAAAVMEQAQAGGREQTPRRQRRGRQQQQQEEQEDEEQQVLQGLNLNELPDESLPLLAAAAEVAAEIEAAEAAASEAAAAASPQPPPAPQPSEPPPPPPMASPRQARRVLALQPQLAPAQ